MTLRSFIVAAMAALPMIGSARADEAIALTPPLYREQARSIGQVRSVSDMTTTPQPVMTSATQRRTVTVADRSVTQASAAATR